jgi:tRNA-uridine 2-sulfurtransferase
MVRKRIIVGMSGGVDSSVAALLLKQQGHEVSGLFMKNWEDDDTDEYCSSREDLVDAVAVAERIGIDIDVVNFSAEYKERVFEDFLAEYQAGRTPNPDVLCNAEIKFKAFLDHALERGADYIATGHYAQVRERDGLFQLLMAEDGTKDQSYFLYRLGQSQLAKAWFPLGGLYKRDVREIARREGLPNHDKKDSTGICFIGERPFREFLSRYLPDNPGEIRTPEGKIVGRHQGLSFYTIGQRQGLRIGGRREGDGEPWYVAAKDLRGNRLIAVQGHDDPALLSDRVGALDLNWISGTPPRCHWVYGAKTRYRQKDAPCILLAATHERCLVQFAEPQWAVTPGQSVVIYESQVCLGGGIIEYGERTADAENRSAECPPGSVGMDGRP